MIKAIFTAITGIDESIDDPENVEAWERQREIDEQDIEEDQEQESEPEIKRGFWLW